MAIWIKMGGKKLDLFAQKRRGRVLDFPAGRGQETRHLVGLGYRAVAADLFFTPPEGSDLSWVLADAQQSFPFRDGSFDYVLSREGIEHLEDQAFFIRNSARMLKPGGELVLTTPNIMHLRSKLTFLLIGQRTLRRGLINEVQTVRAVRDGRYYHGHAFLIDYFRLRYLLRLAGFDNIQVFTDRYSPASLWLGWLVPMMYFASKLAVSMSARKLERKRLKIAETHVIREILAHVFSPALLFGKRMIVVARKGQWEGKSVRAEAEEACGNSST